ncbi:MAG: dUTP diphosphatase [Parachlamydiales bacterium]|nr:dUTP diphosphatase [Parachlamydiales bacterium]
MKTKIKIITKDKKYTPIYATIDSAGADLFAAIEESEFLEPKKIALIPCGIFLEIPKGFEVQIRPRSGLSYKNQITVLNTPGTIDSDYRGEIKVILINHSDKTFEVQPMMKIAQMIVAPVYQAEFENVKELVQTIRGEGGFGHTGTH